MAWEGALFAVALASAAYGAYNSYEQTQAIKKQTRPNAPQLRPVADTGALDEQRRKRLASADGRDQTILAPPGALLGLPGPGAAAGQPKTTLGA